MTPKELKRLTNHVSLSIRPKRLSKSQCTERLLALPKELLLSNILLPIIEAFSRTCMYLSHRERLQRR